MRSGVHFGVISAYPRADWHSRRLIEACARAGHVEVFAPTELGLHVGSRGRTRVLAGGRDARRIDAWLLPRALGRRGDPDFQCGVYRALTELGHPLLNPVDALLLAEDKVATSWRLARAGVPTPPIVAVQSLPEAELALAELGVAVAKPPYGSLGEGVELIVADGPGRRGARARLRAMLRRHQLVYLQRHVAGDGDLRLFVVGRRVAGAIRRVAPPGALAANLHQGGRAHAFVPGAALARIAVRATVALGLEYAGVDLIEGAGRPTVIEVNGTPRWQGILGATGRDMAPVIVAHATAAAATRSHDRRTINPRRT